MTDNDELVYRTAEYVEGLTDEVKVCHKHVDALMQEASAFDRQLDHDIERMCEIDTQTSAVLQALQSGTFDESQRQSELEKLIREYDELTQPDNATLRYTEIINELLFTIDVIIDIESELACDAVADATTLKQHGIPKEIITRAKQCPHFNKQTTL